VSTKYAAQNTYLYIGDGGTVTENFYKVAFLQDIQLPKIKADLIDVSTQDETDHYHDYLSTMIDSGEASFPLVLDTNDITQNETPGVVGVNAGGLKWLMDNRVRRNMRFFFSYTSPATRLRFVATVTGYAGDAKVKGNLAATVTMKILGKTTMEAGTGTGA
jgi:hypothetical protein